MMNTTSKADKTKICSVFTDVSCPILFSDPETTEVRKGPMLDQPRH